MHLHASAKDRSATPAHADRLALPAIRTGPVASTDCQPCAQSRTGRVPLRVQCRACPCSPPGVALHGRCPTETEGQGRRCRQRQQQRDYIELPFIVRQCVRWCRRFGRFRVYVPCPTFGPATEAAANGAPLAFEIPRPSVPQATLDALIRLSLIALCSTNVLVFGVRVTP